MNDFYINEFKKILNEKERGYVGHYKYDNESRNVIGLSHPCWFVDVKDVQGRIIQVFVLMRSSFRTRKGRYPIWESYHQTVNHNGLEVKPAVFIVTLNDGGEWKVYSAGDTSTEKDFDSIVNYKLAYERFDMRVEAIKKYGKMVSSVRCVSWIFAALLTIYLIAHVVTNALNGFVMPLTNQFVLLCGMIAFFILLPIILPYTKKVSINGLDLMLNTN